MNLTYLVLWLLLAAFFLAVEAGTTALVSMWFCIGSLAAFGVGMLGGASWLQGLVFVLVSGAMLALLRPMLRKYVKISRTNVDSVIGTMGYVIADIDNIAATGQVKLGGMTWTARSTSGAPICEGTQIVVDRVEGVKVFVSPAAVPNNV